MILLVSAWPVKTQKGLEEEGLAGMLGPLGSLLEVAVSKGSGSSGGISCPILLLSICTKRSCFRIPYLWLIPVRFPSKIEEQQHWMKPCGSLLSPAQALVICGNFFTGVNVMKRLRRRSALT